jgi:glycosyltransferase involved in cell wall biosynthesis
MSLQTKDKPRLLVLTPRYPYPVVGGDRLRIYWLCRELAKRYSLTLLTLCDSSDEMTAEQPNDGVFDRIQRVYLPKWQSFLNVLGALPTKTPLQVAYYKSARFAGKLQELLSEHDVCLAHLIRTGDYIRNCNIPTVLEMTDAISMNYERLRNVSQNTNLKSFIYSIEQKRLKVYEQKIVVDIDVSILVSQCDKDYLFANSPQVAKKVLVCSNGVDVTSLPYDHNPDGFTLVFIGNLYSLQNVDAAFWFARNVMPLLRKYGNFRFKVIGRIYDSDKKRFKKFSNVDLTGAVDSVVEDARRALAGICSVRIGAGVQNKVLEYMSLGIPAIVSPVGMEGLNAQPDKEVLVAKEPEDYVNAVLRLTQNVQFAQSLAKNGRAFVEMHHSWEKRLAPLVDKIDNLI